METSLSKAEFEAQFRALLEGAEKLSDNVGCVQCEKCEGCQHCTFCKDSIRLSRCQYCVKCTDCSDSSHCRACEGCTGCVHCVESKRCVSSAYVIRSVGLTHCTYCFGCVGLSRKDFHILNKPYDRRTYFALTAKLTKELGIK